MTTRWSVVRRLSVAALKRRDGQLHANSSW